MCKKCEEKIENLDNDGDLILLLFAIIGGLVDSYVEDGYCDPAMYKAVKLAELAGKKLGIPTEMLDRISILKIQAGELVVKIAQDEKMDLPDDWSL